VRWAEGGDFARDYAIGADVKPAPRREASVHGHRRSDGRVATRNYIGVLSSVNCSATAARAIADHFSRQTNPRGAGRFPDVDGVVALTHGTGCGMDTRAWACRSCSARWPATPPMPTSAGVLVVGLGCEANQINAWLAGSSLREGETLKVFNIQDTGGTRKTVDKGMALIRRNAAAANRCVREPCSAEHITIGLQCGGSDGYSGISANPALGAAVDLLVAHGGTAILSETPEIYGAEHLLTRRAVHPDDRRQADRTHQVVGALHPDQRWRDEQQPLARQQGGWADHHPREVAGCRGQGRHQQPAGGLRIRRAVRHKGLRLHGHAGLRPGQRHRPGGRRRQHDLLHHRPRLAYGCAPSPSLKLATNSALWRKQEDDMDINCGEIVDGNASIAEMGQRIFDLVLATASGQASKSERTATGRTSSCPGRSAR
jgi:altronate hydrolase